MIRGGCGDGWQGVGGVIDDLIAEAAAARPAKKVASAKRLSMQQRLPSWK